MPEALANREDLSMEAKSYAEGNITTYYYAGVYAASTEVPAEYESGALEYGYLVGKPNGTTEIVWAGSGALTLSSEVAESAGGGMGGAEMGLIKMIYESFVGESTEGVEAFNRTLQAVELLLESGEITAEFAQEQCRMAKDMLRGINPSFVPAQNCSCLGAGGAIDESADESCATGPHHYTLLPSPCRRCRKPVVTLAGASKTHPAARPQLAYGTDT